MGCCEKYKEIAEFLTCALQAEVAKGIQDYDTKEAGEIIDQILDMKKAIKEHYEGLYYKLVSMAMLGVDSEEMLEMKEVMGYNHRHLNNGEFASAGRGHVVYGYNPMMKEEQFTGAYLRDPEQFRHNMMERYGYDNNSDGRRNDSNRGNGNRSSYDDMNWDDRGGKSFNEYRNAKKYYHETGDLSSKKRMEDQAMKSFEDFGEAALDMFDDADPAMQKRLRETFLKFADKMKV